MERLRKMRRVWPGGLALALVVGASVVRAQPSPEGPPVPPETENAARARPAADSGNGGAASAVQGASSSPPLAAPAAATPGAMSASAGAAGAAGSGPRDALSAFPPAPPPSEPGPPEPPTTALTSFAPAPAPPPGGAPQPAAAAASGEESATTTSASDAAASGTSSATATSSAPAAVSGTGTAAGAGTDAGSESADYAPSGDERWSASALAGVGVTFDNTLAGVNPLGFGFGVRADYRVLPEWSVGARMLYFVGGSVELPTSDLAMQSWLIAAEAAYVIQLDQILIQPGIALGLHVREIDYRGFAGVIGGPEMLIPPDTTRLGLYVAPGVNIAVPLGYATPSLAPLIAGVDVRLDLAFGKSVTSNIELLVLAGFQF